jgi:predicted transposase YbfD/YdcC
MTPLALVDVLAELPGPRSPHGRIHPLTAVLSLVVLGLLRGRKSLAGIARLGRQLGFPFAHALGFTRGKTPATSTLSEILRALDVAALESLLARWAQSRLPADVSALSLDGKTLRGSRDGVIPGQHLVAAYAHQAEAVLGQLRVDAKTNEHKAALQLLGILPVRGKVVLGDALFCQRDVAEAIHERGGDYVLLVKDNQPGLETDIKAGLGYEAGARSIAAATFSPRRAAAPAAGEGGVEHRQGARANREADAASDPDPDAARAVGGIETGL